MAYAFSVSSGIAICTQSGTETSLTGIATAITNQATVARSTAYAVGALVKPPAANGMWYRCSTAGTTAATAPTYNPVEATTTTDGTAVFTSVLAPIVRTLGTQSHYYMPAFRLAINGTLTIANPQIENFTCWDVIQYGAASIFTSGSWATDGVTPLYDAVHFTATRVSANNSDNSSGGFQLQNGSQATFIGGEIQVAGAIGIASGTTLRTYSTRWRGTKQWGGVSSTRIRAYSTTSIFRNCEFYDIAYDLFQMPAEFSVKARKCEYVAQYVGSVAGGVDAYFKASALENVDGVYDFDNYGNGYVELFNCAKGANLNVVTQLNATMCTPLYQDLRLTAKDTAGNAVQDVRFTCTDIPNNSPTQTFTTRGGLKVWNFINPLSYQTTTNASGIALSSPVLQVWYYSNGLKKNLRFPLSTAVYEGRAYNFKTMTTSVVLGSNSIQDVTAGMIGLDTATTLTEANAALITGISLVPSGTTGGTITISSSKSLQDIWNYYRWWISQFANRTSNDTWTCIGGKLDSKVWTLIVNTGVTISGDANIGSYETSGTVTNNGTITAIYTNSTGTSARLNYSGLVASTIYTTNGSGAQYDLQINLTGSFINYLSPNSTGTWGWVSERYGYARTSGVFTPLAGGDYYAAPLWIPDASISVTTQATVSAYTIINTLDQLYDYAAYMRTQQPAYVLASKSGTTLDFGATNIVFDATASSVWNYNSTTNTLTIKASTIVAGAKFTSVKTTTNLTFVNGAIATCVYVNSTGASTVLQLNTPSAGYSLCIFKADGTTKYFNSGLTAGSYYVYFTPSEAGTYYLAAENYGQKRTADTLVLNGGNVWYNITDQEDVGITDTKTNVSAYTTLSTTSQIYDATAYFRLSETGIKLGQLAARDGLYLDFGTYNVKIKDDATVIVAVASGTITYKSIIINETTKYNAVKATPPATITATDTEQINVLIEDANGDSQITILGGASPFSIYKFNINTTAFPVGTIPDTRTDVGNFVTSITDRTYRFLYDANYNYFVYSPSIRSDANIPNVVDGQTAWVAITKGKYSAPLYKGNEIQLASDAPQLTENNQKLSELILKIDTDLPIINENVKDASILIPASRTI